MTDGLNAYQEAVALVTEKFETSQAYATQALESVNLLLDNLINASSALETLDEDVIFDEQGIDIDPDTLGPPPTVPDLETDFPTPPPQAEFQTIDISDLVEPSISNLLLPVVSIDPGQNEYTSNLLSALTAKLLNDVVNGGTGLDPLIEADIWNRNYERDLQNHFDAMDRIADTWAKKGNPLPDGFLANLLMEEEINYSNKRADVSREIAIKQAELAQSNTHFAVQQGVAVETQLMTIANQFAERIFQASKAIMDSEIALYNAQLQSYRILTDIYQVLVTVRIEKAKGVVEIYKSQVQAYQAAVSAEAERVRAILLKSQTEMEIYKTQASTYQIMSSVNISLFDAKIKQAVAKADIALKNAEINIKNYEAINGIKIESIKAAGTIAAHLVSGALSAVSAGASISGQGQTQTSTSTSTSTIHHYEEIPS